jgi:hypothetical protein
MPYTHSLTAAILWSIGAVLTYRLAARPRPWPAATVVGAAVLSHWFLDVLVHRPVLPLYDNQFKVGLALYHLPVAALILEIGLLFGGVYYYLNKTRPVGRAGRYGITIFGVVFLALLAFVSFGPALRLINVAASAALFTWLILAGAAASLERTRV